MRFAQAFAGAAFEEDVVRQHDRGGATVLEDGEDVLEEVEPQCRCGSHLLVLAQKSLRSMTSESSGESARRIMTPQRSRRWCRSRHILVRS